MASPAVAGIETYMGVQPGLRRYLDAREDPTKSFELMLTGAFLDGTGIIGNDGTTAPGVAETDNVPAIVYASSAEQVKCQWTFTLPTDYASSS